MVTDQQRVYELAEPEIASSQALPEAAPLGRGTQVMAAGLQFLSSHRNGRRWSSGPGLDVLTTAYILARLGEFPLGFFSHGLYQQIEDSLDWLMETQTSGGGWSLAPRGTSDDAGATAWAILALGRHRRAVPETARAFLRRCRRTHGAFAPCDDVDLPGSGEAGLPVTTALAIQAVGIVTGPSVELLEQNIVRSAGRQSTEALLLCSYILDWQPGAASQSLLDEVGRCVRRFIGKTTLDQALLLRCLVRLRMQEAWTAAAELGRMQQADGSWPGSSWASMVRAFPGPLLEDRQVNTATALSALALRSLQPGLYFGSDLPFRRLDEV